MSIFNGSFSIAEKNRYIVIAGFLCCALLIWFCCCESRVPSIRNPNTSVTRDELNTEIEGILSSAEAKYSNLDKQDDLKKLLSDNALLVLQGGTINPVGVITTILGILGIGAVVDNRRKDKVIRQKITEIKNATTGSKRGDNTKV